jgi:hypothetical protein
MPQGWWPLLESIIAQRHPPLEAAAANTTSDDLEIPTFLRCELIAAPLNAKLDSAPQHDSKVDDPGAAYPRGLSPTAFAIPPDGGATRGAARFSEQQHQIEGMQDDKFDNV